MFGDPVTNSKGWPTKPLSEVAPESPSRHQIEGIVWNLNLDMIESNSGTVISKIYEEVNRLLSVSQFDQGNVLISKLRPYLNKVVVPDEIGYATTELVPLRPDQELLNKYFLAHLLRGHHFVSYANAIATGTKMPRMPMNSLRSFKCILPPMELQQQFVNIAEQADKSKFMRSKSQFIEMFWGGKYTMKKLRGHIEVLRGVSYKPSDVHEDLSDNTSIVLRSNNIDGGQINFDDLVYVDSERVSEHQVLNAGDIVMCGSNGSKKLVGKAALLNETPIENTSFGAFCLGIRCKSSIIPEYLATYFQTSLYRDKIEALGSGSNILNIKPDHIYDLEIPIPSLGEQETFVSIVKQADKSKLICLLWKHCHCRDVYTK